MIDDARSSDLQAALGDAATQATFVAVAIWTIVGFALRLGAARGDLWLDEIWNIRLLERTTTVWDVFFDLPYDSNHPLNSAWLALVGPSAPPLVLRLASVLEGTACIPLAALWASRRNPGLAWIGAAFVALCPLFVQFGSEARGYAALMLAMLAALACLDPCLETRTGRRPTAWLAICIALGTLAHPTMIVFSAVLATTAAIRLAIEGGPVRDGLRRWMPIAIAIVLGTLPASAAWFVAISRMTPHIGGLTPWSLESFALGLGRLAQATLGLPLLDRLAVPALLTGLALTLVGLGLVPARQQIFPLLAILGVPAMQALLHVPNEEYARFHLVTGVAFATLAIDATVAAWARPGLVRGSAIAFACLVGLGQAADLATFLRFGRGGYAQAVATMAAEGPATIAIEQDWIVRESRLVIDWYAARRDATLMVAPLACPGRTDWLIRVDQPGGDVPAPAEIAAPATCPTRYRLRETERASGLSGFTWHLYRRASS